MELDLNELERLANAAAPGPWRRQDFYSSGSKNGVDDSDGGVVCASYGYRRDADFDFIAAANPAVLLELVRRRREAEARVAELEADAARYRYIRTHRIGVKWCELYAGGPELDAAIDAMMNPPKGHES